MKTENTHENKARFFALYYGQRVYKKAQGAGTWVLDYDRIGRDGKYGRLSLRSISSLTDMELGNVLNYYDRHLGEHYESVTYMPEFDRETGEITAWYYDSLKRNRCYTLEFNSLPQPCTDYLRSISILIPWMDLEVRDIKIYGWAKIEGDE